MRDFDDERGENREQAFYLTGIKSQGFLSDCSFNPFP